MRLQTRLQITTSKRRNILKKQIGIASVVVGALTYSFLVFTTYKGTGEGLSLSTFGLWAVLAWITSFTTMKEGANPAIPAIYGLGSTATSLVLLVKGKYSWSHFDSLVAVLVIICIVFWMTKGAKWALVFSVVAAVIAGLPYVVMTWKAPMLSPIIPNAGFLTANTLAFIAAGSWTIKDRLYTGTSIVTCSLLVTPWLLCK